MCIEAFASMSPLSRQLENITDTADLRELGLNPFSKAKADSPSDSGASTLSYSMSVYVTTILYNLL